MLLRRCLGPGQGDKGSLFPIKQADICQLTSIQRGDVKAAECKTKWPSLLTGPWHTIERSESSKEKESQKGQDSSHMEKASLEQIPRAKKKHVEKKNSLLRELHCVRSGSKEPGCVKGLSHLLGLSRMSSFSSAWVQQTSCFLCPRAVSLFGSSQPGDGAWQPRWQLASHWHEVT